MGYYLQQLFFFLFANSMAGVVGGKVDGQKHRK